MRGFGTHHQPRTWSDDTLTFCLAEALEEFSLSRIAKKFVLWKYRLLWTPHGEIFDIGIQTSKSIDTLKNIIESKDFESLKYLKYDADEYTNGTVH